MFYARLKTKILWLGLFMLSGCVSLTAAAADGSKTGRSPSQPGLLPVSPPFAAPMAGAPAGIPAVQNSLPVVAGTVPANPPVTPIPSADSLYYSQPEPATNAADIVVARPPLQALISVESSLDPFQLDAQSCRQVTLADVVDIALHNNLNIQSSALDLSNNRWKLLNSYTRFLPDARLGYIYDRARGHIRLPGAFGSALGGAGMGPLRINTPFIVAQAGVHYNAFQGGKVLFGALQARNNYRAARYHFRATTNDVLMEATKRYYNLLLAEALLQIRIRAVQTSEEQLRVNEDLERDGMATHLDVLQARTQLADDRQNLIEQQISRRNNAIQLAEYLNFDQSIDLQPVDTVVQPVRLIGADVLPGKLLGVAAQNRPELKQYREQWLSSKKGIMIAAAPLYPTVQLNATEFGIGETLSNAKRTVVTPGSAATGAGGTTAGGSSLSPITLSGSSSSSSAAIPPKVTRVSRQITGLGVIGLTANWNLDAFGLNAVTDVQAARAQARQAMVQSNQEVNSVISQVRQAYLNQLSALRRSEQNLARVQSSAEELRLAQLRLNHGLGKNIDVLRAQQDLTNALVQHAQSTIEFNTAQAQLLHDIGVITRTTLLSSTPQSFQ